MAEDRNLVPARLVLVGPERPSQLRRHTEQSEERRAYFCPVEPYGLALTGQDRARSRERRGILQCRIELPDIGEVRPRHRRATPLGLVVDTDQLLRIGIGQRLQQDGIDDTEDGGIGADSQGEREQRHGGERGALDQPPKSVANILAEVVHSIR
jgi:hypothetical protein